jgi:hypothetical protein
VALFVVGLLPVSTLACELACAAGEASMHHHHGMDHASMPQMGCADGPAMAATQPPCAHGITSIVSTVAAASRQAVVAPVVLHVAVAPIAPPSPGGVAPGAALSPSPPGALPALFVLRI